MDRDYFRSAEQRWRSPATWLASTSALWLVGLHAATATVTLISLSEGYGWPLQYALMADRPPALAILTHAFVAVHVLPTLGVLALLMTCGRLIEEDHGGRILFASYLIATLMAGAIYWLVARVAPNFAAVPLYMPYGALATWTVGLMRLPGPEVVLPAIGAFSRRSVIAVIAIVLLAFSVYGRGLGALAWIAALAAGGLGLPLAEYAQGFLAARRRRTPRAVVVRVTVPAESSDINSEPPDLDQLLEKISRTGLASLSSEERARLEAARRKLIDRT